jgi:hypothetical protein
MPRPRKLRWVQGRPIAAAFAPDQMPPWGREEVVLSIRDENLGCPFIPDSFFLPFRLSFFQESIHAFFCVFGYT